MADTDKNTVNIPDSVLENNLEKDNVIKNILQEERIKKYATNLKRVTRKWRQ